MEQRNPSSLLMQLDYQNLKGMVYQVWALKLNPLTPTSIGLLDKFTKTTNFAVNNTGDRSLRITLEPAGGSLSPTMEQLYTLGRCNLL
jgi:anti-sigma-K factor RskA